MQVSCGHLVGTVPGRDNTFDEHRRDAHWRVIGESVKQGIDWDGIDPLALISPFLLE